MKKNSDPASVCSHNPKHKLLQVLEILHNVAPQIVQPHIEILQLVLGSTTHRNMEILQIQNLPHLL